MTQEHSYGIVPLQKQNGEWHVLLIQHRAAGYWGFPKGRPEPGETAMQTAFRELKEETGMEVVHLFSEVSLDVHYHFHHSGKQVRKSVSFFVGEVTGTVVLQVGEVCASQWVPLSVAEQTLTYTNDKTVLKDARNIVLKGHEGI